MVCLLDHSTNNQLPLSYSDLPSPSLCLYKHLPLQLGIVYRQMSTILNEIVNSLANVVLQGKIVCGSKASCLSFG